MTKSDMARELADADMTGAIAVLHNELPWAWSRRIMWEDVNEYRDEWIETRRENVRTILGIIRAIRILRATQESQQ
jgi:hypothetical protein